MVFLVLTFAISWALWAPLVALGEFPGGPLLGLAGSFGPFAAAAIVTRRRHGTLRPLWEPLLKWRVSWIWYAIAILLPVVGVLLAALAVRALGGGGADPAGWGAFPAVLLFSMLLGGGHEEPGWRGVAQPGLQRRSGVWTAAVGIGVVWAVWHLPLFLIEGASQSSMGLAVWAYLLYVPAVSVLLAWLYNATGGSVLLCVICHGALNAAAVAGYPFGGRISELVLIGLAWVMAAGAVLVHRRTDGGGTGPPASPLRRGTDAVTG